MLPPADHIYLRLLIYNDRQRAENILNPGHHRITIHVSAMDAELVALALLTPSKKSSRGVQYIAALLNKLENST